ncbi:MAG: hypothetical protein ACRDF1_05755, partial [bacterium]
TRTRKLRRHFISERYQDLIRAICAGAPEYSATFTVRYEDGRTTDVHTTLQIRDVTAVAR